MTALPVLHRELQVAARRPSTFGVRFFGAMLATLLGGLFLAGAAFPAGLITPSGSALFGTLVSLGMILSLLSGPLLTAVCLSSERREGTLGLLFLTTLDGWDVVTGKFVALALVPLHGLLATVPVAALTFCLGGVTGGELARAYVVLLNTLFLSLALGLWASSLTADDRVAIGITLGALLLLGAVPEVLVRLLGALSLPLQLGLAGTSWDLQGIALASPTGLLRQAFDSPYRLSPDSFWWACVAHHALAWLCLIAAGVIVKRAWREREVPSRPPAPAPTGGFRPIQRLRQARHRRLRTQGPLAWPSLPSPWIHRGVWGVVVLTWLTATLAFAVLAHAAPRSQAGSMATWIALGGLGVLKLLLAIHTAFSLNDACRSGAFELVLVTPVSSRTLLDSHLAALRRVFLWPYLTLSALLLAAGVGGRIVVGGDWPSTTAMIAAGALPALFSIAVHGLDLLAIAYHASRWALTYDRPVKAIARTTFVVLLLPTLLCWNGRFLIDLIVIGRARPILERFRELTRGWFFPGPAAARFGAPHSG